jgi:hypothetical protein
MAAPLKFRKVHFTIDGLHVDVRVGFNGSMFTIDKLLIRYIVFSSDVPMRNNAPNEAIGIWKTHQLYAYVDPTTPNVILATRDMAVEQWWPTLAANYPIPPSMVNETKDNIGVYFDNELKRYHPKKEVSNRQV